MIDTPGMRELALWDGDRGFEQVFSDVEELASACRFRDCRHDGEPGCRVEGALAAGVLDPDRLESYRKLQKELRFASKKRDLKARIAEKRRQKAFTRMCRTRTRGGH